MRRVGARRRAALTYIASDYAALIGLSVFAGSEIRVCDARRNLRNDNPKVS